MLNLSVKKTEVTAFFPFYWVVVVGCEILATTTDFF